jgi:hypothetical protein
MVDTISITKGHGVKGVIARFGVSRLPRKTHKGLHKVACIGSWHPARIRTTVPRAGQSGYHHRTEINKKIYGIGAKGDEKSCTTDQDPTVKGINPMGRFVHYGMVTEDFLLIKGGVPDVVKRLITLRKLLHERTSRAARPRRPSTSQVHRYELQVRARPLPGVGREGAHLQQQDGLSRGRDLATEKLFSRSGCETRLR